MPHLVEQGQRPDHRPQVEMVEGQNLVYPDVGTCITVTYCRTGPPSPYLVGVHLGMYEHDMNPIQQATVASAMTQMKARLEPRSFRLTKRRPHVSFIIGWISDWQNEVPARYTEVENHVRAWQRRGGTRIFIFDLGTMNPAPNTATITFTSAPTYTISITGTHSTRNAAANVWTHTPVVHNGMWHPPASAQL